MNNSPFSAHILLIDNHDSFTHLLGDAVWRATGVRPMIVPNNSPELTAATIAQTDLVVVSPGPGHPGVAEDVGASKIAVEQADTPVIGVCLGHQLIALDAGAKVERAAAPMHGLSSQVIHNEQGIFAGISSPMQVVRYHSLDVTDPPPAIEVVARADDGTIMALRRTDRPQWGVQFHPESIGTPDGVRLLSNLIEETGVLRARLWRREELHTPPHPAQIAALWAKHYPYVCWLDTADSEPGTHIIGAGHQTVHPADLPQGRLSPDSAETATNFVPGALGVLRYEATGGWDGARPQQVDAQERLLAPDVVFQYEQGQGFLLLPDAGVDAPPMPTAPALPEAVPPAPEHGELRLRHSREEYVELVRRCQEFIDRGESYELCLTTSASVAVPDVDPVELYLRLRALAPAPMAGLWISPEVAVLSASPERFVRVRDGVMEAAPVKGTRPRGADANSDAALRAELASSEKDRAENIMIVDLLRNDLARSCVPGSVAVPELCRVYTYSRAHQLVSTITGVLPQDGRGFDAALLAFPGGSMTGAPKQRSMDILAELEHVPRGFYSGSMGYVSATGEVDFNILIRTAVLEAGALSYGAGGAVTRLSDPDAEFEEVLVKLLPLRLLLGRDEL